MPSRRPRGVSFELHAYLEHGVPILSREAYPAGFPDSLKNDVEAARAKADLVYAKSQYTEASPALNIPREPSITEHIDLRSIRFIATVFAAFSRAACIALQQGQWTGEQLRRGIEEFLDHLIDCTYWAKEHHMHPYIESRPIIFKSLVKNHPEFWSVWEQHLNERATVLSAASGLVDQEVSVGRPPSEAIAPPPPAAHSAFLSADSVAAVDPAMPDENGDRAALVLGAADLVAPPLSGCESGVDQPQRDGGGAAEALTDDRREDSEQTRSWTLRTPRLLSPDDPLHGVNPFPVADDRHRLWREATLTAEEETHRLEARLIETSLADYHAAPVDTDQANCLREWFYDVTVSKFDIWSKRDLSVLFEQALVPGYENTLVTYAELWLGAAYGNALKFQADTGVDVGVDSLMLELKARIMARLAYWRAEARVRVQSATCAQGRRTTDTPAATQAPFLSTDPAAIDTELAPAAARGPFGRLAAWLNNEMSLRDLTAFQLEKRGGPNHETITKALNGQPVSNITIQRLAKGLAHAPGLSPQEITNREREILSTLQELCAVETSTGATGTSDD